MPVQAGRTRAEGLEGALAECRGRAAGLGEGCGRCWELLDGAQVCGLPLQGTHSTVMAPTRSTRSCP